MLGRDRNRRYGRDDADPASVWGDLQPRIESLDGVSRTDEDEAAWLRETMRDRSDTFGTTTSETATVSWSRCEPVRSGGSERDDPRVYERSRPTVPRWQGRFPNSKIER